MYDAVNCGFRRAAGDILAYINCDEQYLPGALAKVLAFFDRHPEIDVLFADTVVVDSNGHYLCDRKALTPQKHHSLVSGNLAFLTCATFFRRRVLEQHNLYFDPNLRDVGDCDWALRLIKEKVRMTAVREFTSVFTETGANMNLLPNAQREKEALLASAPLWCRKLRRLIVLHFRLRRFFSGAYSRRPYEYSIYTKASPGRRQTFKVTEPTFRWIRPAPQLATAATIQSNVGR